MREATTQLVTPYRSLAQDYDCALGLRFFQRARASFERMQQEYGFTFRSAADVGCGTGLFARYLARKWHVSVFAVDRSREMLDQAERVCRGECVELFQQDLRQLRLPYPVDLITANYDVLNHLIVPSDLRLALRRVRENLRCSGHFYFDLITPCLALPSGKWTRWTRPTPHGLLRQLLLWDPCRRLLQIHVVSKRFDRCCLQVERHVERAYGMAEMARWLGEAGLVLRGLHDEATTEFAGQCAPRMLFLAQCR